MKKQMLVALILIAGVAHAQEFPQSLLLDCSVGRRFYEVDLGQELFDDEGRTLRKAGMVGLRWRGAEPVWAKAEKQADGSFRVAFPGRKPMTIKELRKLTRIKELREPVDDSDSDVIVTIQEDGGKVIRCIQTASF